MPQPDQKTLSQLTSLQKQLHAARTEAASLRQKLRLSEAAAERAVKNARDEERRRAALKEKAVPPPKEVVVRREARIVARMQAAEHRESKARVEMVANEERTTHLLQAARVRAVPSRRGGDRSTQRCALWRSPLECCPPGAPR